MAKKGIRYAVFGKYTETTNKDTGAVTISYTDGKYLAPVAAFTGTPNNSNQKDYGDDHCVEVANETTGASLSVELTNDDLDIFAMLLGHDLTEGKLVYSVNDVAPYVGVGAIGKSGSKWRAKFYKKVLFAEPTDENTTKQENTSFGHLTLEGDAIPLDDGTWKEEKEFDTVAAAKTYLNGLVGIPS